MLYNYEEEFKKLEEKKKKFPFMVWYRYEDTMEPSFSNNGDFIPIACDFIPIAYGDDPFELAKLAEEKGYHRAMKAYDPKGYRISFNIFFPKKNITHEMREALDKYHGWRGNQAELS